MLPVPLAWSKSSDHLVCYQLPAERQWGAGDKVHCTHCADEETEIQVLTDRQGQYWRLTTL